MVDPLKKIRAAVASAGSQTAFAKAHGLSIPYVSDVLAGRRPPADRILKAVGLRRRVIYEKDPRYFETKAVDETQGKPVHKQGRK